MTTILVNLWPHILIVTAAVIVGFCWEPTWQEASRKPDALLADTDADLDAQMVAACQREADRELLASSATPEFDRLSVEFFNAALGDDASGRLR